MTTSPTASLAEPPAPPTSSSPTPSPSPISWSGGRRRPWRRWAATAIVPLVMLAGACSGSDSAGGGAGDSAVTEEQVDVAGSDARDSAEDAAQGDADGGARDSAARTNVLQDTLSNRTAPGDPDVGRAVISTGNVALASDDVAQTAFDVQQVVDRHAGETTEQETSTEDGEAAWVRMVLRIPSDAFTAAFDDIEELAELTSSSASAEDVTSEVIDTEVRIRAQRRSLQRVEVLLDRATSIGDIVRIEAQLTDRQAALDSLEQRAAYLADQTSMSTVTVSIERASTEGPAAEEDDGFLAGLSGGWSAMVGFTTGLATATGWLLPFLGLVALVAVPGWLVWRGRRRRTAAGPVSGAGAAG